MKNKNMRLPGGPAMQPSQLPVHGTIGRYCRVCTVIAISAMFLAAGSDDTRYSSDGTESYEVAKKSTRHKRIKRLKLADPESTEVMLA